VSASRLITRELIILESGDALSEPLRERLSRTEFERRYQALPQLKKAELIEGVVYVASPGRRLCAAAAGSVGHFAQSGISRYVTIRSVS